MGVKWRRDRCKLKSVGRFTRLLFLLPLAGCAVHFVAPYDATLDNAMTQVQHDTELFFNQLEETQGAGANYDTNKDFYIRTESTVKTLLTRAQAVPKNHLVADQIARIESTLERDQAQHKRDQTLSSEVLKIDQQTLESEFRSFFSLELALKTHFGNPPSAALAPATQSP